MSERLKEKYHDISPGLPLKMGDGHHVFDGGDEGNSPLVRPFGVPETHWTLHSVRRELTVISCPPDKGVCCRIGGHNECAYTPVPRQEALGLFKGDLTREKLIEAC